MLMIYANHQRWPLSAGLRDADIGELLICDPYVRNNSEFSLCSLENAVENADIIVLLVDHRPFKRLKPSTLQEKVLIDTRGVFSMNSVSEFIKISAA